MRLQSQLVIARQSKPPAKPVVLILYQKQQRNGKGLSYRYYPFEKNEQELRKLQRNPIIFMYGSNKMMWLCVPYTVLKCIWQWRDIAFNVLREYVFLYNRPLFSKQCKKLLCSIKSPSKKEMSCKEPFAKNKKHGKMLFDTVFIKSYIDSIAVLVIKNFHKNHTLTNRQPLKELSVIKMLKCHKVSFLFWRNKNLCFLTNVFYGNIAKPIGGFFWLICFGCYNIVFDMVISGGDFSPDRFRFVYIAAIF